MSRTEFLWKTAVFIFHSPCGVRKSEGRKAINTATPACHLCLWCLQGRSPQGPTYSSAVHCRAFLPLSSADGPASTTGAIQARGPRCTSTLVLRQTASPSSPPLPTPRKPAARSGRFWPWREPTPLPSPGASSLIKGLVSRAENLLGPGLLSPGAHP